MAKRHLVKCYYCSNTFDANIEPYIMINSRRYAHEQCYKEKQQNEDKTKKDKEILELYIKQLFSYDKIPVRVYKQIKDFVEKDEYTYSGIYKTLKYWFEVQKGDIKKANGGIAIVEYKYEQAREYYRDLEETKERNKKASITPMDIPTKKIYIRSFKREPMKHKRRLFKFLDQEDEV